MKVVKLNYCSEFECLAEKCPETCCRQWNIFFSRSDYLKIKSSPCSEKLKSIIDDSFVRLKGNGASEDFNYAVIKFNEKGFCPLLDGDGLCLLQKELGEACLGFVCSSFPRLKTAVGNDTYIYSCNMSCPKVAELLISHSEGLRLICEKYDEGDRYLNLGLYSAPAVFEGWEGFPYYWDIKNAQIEILQNRSFSLPERMLTLGYFSQKANEYINHKSGTSIALLAKTLRDRETFAKISESLKPAQTDKSFAVKSAGIFAKLLLSARRKGGKYLNELFQRVSDSIGLTFEEAENNRIDTAFSYDKYFKNIETFRKIERERPHITENILVNYIFTQSPAEGILKNYFISAVLYNTLATCIPAFLSDSFDDKDLARAISLAARMTVNNSLIEKDILLDFVDNRSYTLPHAAFLII